MQKLVFILVIVAVAGGLVITGWHFGSQRGAKDALYAESVLEKGIGDAEATAEMLHELDAGDTNAVRRVLQSKLVMCVMTVDSLSPYGDTKDQQLAQSLFATVAKYRAEGSPSFAGDLGGWSTDSLARLDVILKKASHKAVRPPY